MTDTPKLFISYCWSSPEHEAWVLNLAEELVGQGINVLLDKWDLREGHEANKFMERMVTDPTVTKVAMIFDKQYAEKANSRTGGVGTETQIISAEIFNQQNPDKFVGIIAETDENGKHYAPAYFTSRIFIDLHNTEEYSENFEQLVRWIYDKPLYVKPMLGNRPAFLDEEPEKSIGTHVEFRRLADAVRNGRPHAVGAINEYFDKFLKNLEIFRVEKPEDSSISEKVVESIDTLLPAKDELLKSINLMFQYNIPSDQSFLIRKILTGLVGYACNHPENSHHSTTMDNYKFLMYEMMLSVLALCLKYEKFSLFYEIATYQFPIKKSYSEKTFSFFREHEEIYSIREMQRIRNQKFYSPETNLLIERLNQEILNIEEIAIADMVCTIYCIISAAKGNGNYWHPFTLPYRKDGSKFSLFSSAKSKNFFDKMKCIFGVDSIEDLKINIAAGDDYVKQASYGGIRRLSIKELIDLEKMATLP